MSGPLWLQTGNRLLPLSGHICLRACCLVEAGTLGKAEAMLRACGRGPWRRPAYPQVEDLAEYREALALSSMLYEACSCACAVVEVLVLEHTEQQDVLTVNAAMFAHQALLATTRKALLMQGWADMPPGAGNGRLPADLKPRLTPCLALQLTPGLQHLLSIGHPTSNLVARCCALQLLPWLVQALAAGLEGNQQTESKDLVQLEHARTLLR